MNEAMKKHPLWVILLAAGGTFALLMGTRGTMGLFLGDMNSATGLGIAHISLAFAFGQLWWGLTQPFAGAFADRVGAGRVIVVGIVLVAIGTIVTPYMTSTIGLIFAIGVLAAGGAGIAGPSVIMAATTRMVSPEKRGMANGIVNAGGSFGQFVMAPIAAGLVAMTGWMSAMQILGLFVLLALPAAWVFRGDASAGIVAPTSPGTTPDAPVAPTTAREGAMVAISRAFKDRSYVLLAIGFFVCGFHVAFLSTHLPNVVAMCGLPPNIAAWSLAVIGLFNIFGSLLMGWAVGRWRMKSLLSLVYAARAVGVMLFLLSPKTAEVMLVFAAFMGLTFLSTVPPTAGLVAKFFGSTNMATLFGIVMLSHQIGGFLGAWLGGKVFTMTGSYDTIWIIDIVLAIGAALIHMPIKEAPLALKMQAA